jgi:transcriptional regulator with XRE-family HTH domain
LAIVDRIEGLLKTKGIVGSKMSQDLNFSSGLYSQWKRGTQKPSIDKVEKMAAYFNVTTDYLMGLSDYKNDEEKQIVKEEKDYLYDNILALPHGVREAARKFLYRLADNYLLEPRNENNWELYAKHFEVLTSLSHCFISSTHLAEHISENVELVQKKVESEVRERNQENELRELMDLPLKSLCNQSAKVYIANLLSDILAFILANESDALYQIQAYFKMLKELACEELSNNGVLDFIELPEEEAENLHVVLKHLQEYKNKKGSGDNT